MFGRVVSRLDLVALNRYVLSVEMSVHARNLGQNSGFIIILCRKNCSKVLNHALNGRKLM